LFALAALLAESLGEVARLSSSRNQFHGNLLVCLQGAPRELGSSGIVLARPMIPFFRQLRHLAQQVLASDFLLE